MTSHTTSEHREKSAKVATCEDGANSSRSLRIWNVDRWEISLMSITNLNGEGGSPHISDYLRTLWTTTLEMKAFNSSGEINRCHYYEWSILSCVYSIFFCLLYNHTSRDKWPFHGQLGRGSHTSRVIKVADKSFFSLMNLGVSVQPLLVETMCVCVCV